MRIASALLLAIAIGLPLLVVFPPRPLMRAFADAHPEVLFYVETDRQVVALTLDDGPNPQVTPQILDLLAAYDAHATFFLLGDHVEGNENLRDRMRAEGHELGNHLYEDQVSLSLSPQNFEHQLMRTDSLLSYDANSGGKWLRPGSGWFSDRMVEQSAEHGYRLALGSVYPHDLLLQSPKLISEFILKRAHAGSVLILHDGDEDTERTLAVLKRVLPLLKERGFEFLTLSEMSALKSRES